MHAELQTGRGDAGVQAVRQGIQETREGRRIKERILFAGVREGLQGGEEGQQNQTDRSGADSLNSRGDLSAVRRIILYSA